MSHESRPQGVEVGSLADAGRDFCLLCSLLLGLCSALASVPLFCPWIFALLDCLCSAELGCRSKALEPLALPEAPRDSAESPVCLGLLSALTRSVDLVEFTLPDEWNGNSLCGRLGR